MKSAPHIAPAATDPLDVNATNQLGVNAIDHLGVNAIDHLGVVGRDMTKMVAAFTRLGFQPTDPVPLMGKVDGKAVPLGQDSAHLIFRDSYVELSGVTSTDPAHHLAPWLARRDGLHILAFGSADAEASHAALAARGLDVCDVQGAGRQVSYGQNHGEAKFKWFKAPDSLGAEGFVCVVEQITPALVFQPPATGHPNGALGVAGVTVLAENVDEAITRFGSYPGAKATGANTVIFGHQTLTFLDTAGFRDAYPGINTLTAPALAGFTVFVADLEATRTLLASKGVTVNTASDSTIWIHPAEACGSIVTFKAA